MIVYGYVGGTLQHHKMRFLSTTTSERLGLNTARADAAHCALCREAATASVTLQTLLNVKIRLLLCRISR